MSNWTYAACETCQETLWLEKFLGYRTGLTKERLAALQAAGEKPPEEYSLASKAADLAAFYAGHAGHDVRLVKEQEYLEQRMDRWKESPTSWLIRRR